MLLAVSTIVTVENATRLNRRSLSRLTFVYISLSHRHGSLAEVSSLLAARSLLTCSIVDVCCAHDTCSHQNWLLFHVVAKC